MDTPYPPSPPNVPADLARPGAAYRRHTWAAVLALVAFVALYGGLLGWLARAILLALDSLGGRETGVAIAVLIPAIFLGAFLVKGLFFIRRGDVGDAVEVTRTDEPKLFVFLDRLADEVGSPRPHRVFLAPEVNAAVFYDISFWNLVFPTKKNLRLGLGLLNVLTLDELKAVLAHELGHFAQRTMAVGTWVYVSGQVIGALVARRDGFDRFLSGLSRTDLRIAWIGWALRILVWSVRAVLDTAYRGLVFVQRALSREMEFQADLVAASVTGSDSLVHALRRLGPADDALNRAFSFVASEGHAGRRVGDVYTVQTAVLGELRRVLADPELGQVPPRHADGERARLFSPELAEAPRMWATHPADHEREANLKRVYVASVLDARPAWSVLMDPSARRRSATDRFYERIPAAKDKPVVTADATQVELERVWRRPRFDEAHRGVYVGRSSVRIAKSVAELVGTPPADLPSALDALYPPELARTVKAWKLATGQVAQLEALRDGLLTAPGGVLRFRGRDLPRSELSSVLTEATRERDQLRGRLTEHDRAVRTAHRAAAARLGQGWEAYLASCVHTLHYLEHRLADLTDAKVALDSLWNVVTADGKLTEAEIGMVLRACTTLFDALAPIYLESPGVRLPAAALSTLRVKSWESALEAFRLGPPSRQALAGNWLPAAETWVNAASGSLDDAVGATLDALLDAEAHVARCLREGADPGPAPEGAVAPEKYAVLVPGGERPRPKLGWWERFQTASGLGPGLLRLGVASVILGPALLASTALGVGEVVVHNGLGIPVIVKLGARTLPVTAHQDLRVDVPRNAPVEVRTATMAGEEIDAFSETFSGDRVVYNVAGADLFVLEHVSYGGGQPAAPTPVDGGRWFPAGQDYVLTAPPQSIQSEHAETRSVLAAEPGWSPEGKLTAAGDPAALARPHIRWDPTDSADWTTWTSRAIGLGVDVGDVLRARVAEEGAADPPSVELHRLWQEVDHDAACAVDTAKAAANPDDVDALYLSLRCRPDAESGPAFIAAAAAHPESGWLRWAATYELEGRGEWAAAEALLAGDWPPALDNAAKNDRLLLLRLRGAPAAEQAAAADGAALGTLVRAAVDAELAGGPPGPVPEGFDPAAVGLWQVALASALTPDAALLAEPDAAWRVPCSDGYAGPAEALSIPGTPTPGSLGDACRLLVLRAAQPEPLPPEFTAQLDAFRAANPGLSPLLEPVVRAAPGEVAAAVEATASGQPTVARGMVRLFGVVRLREAAPPIWRKEARAFVLPLNRWYLRAE